MGSGSSRSKAKKINDKFLTFCSNYWKNGCTESDMVRFLDQKEVDINYFSKEQHGSGRSPLICALKETSANRSNSIECVRLLLEKGADPNKSGKTPLNIALKKSSPDLALTLIDLLLKHGATVPEDAMTDMAIYMIGSRGIDIRDDEVCKYKLIFDTLRNHGCTLEMLDSDRFARHMFRDTIQPNIVQLVIEYIDDEYIMGDLLKAIRDNGGCSSKQEHTVPALYQLYHRGAKHTISKWDDECVKKLFQKYPDRCDPAIAPVPVPAPVPAPAPDPNDEIITIILD